MLLIVTDHLLFWKQFSKTKVSINILIFKLLLLFVSRLLAQPKDWFYFAVICQGHVVTASPLCSFSFTGVCWSHSLFTGDDYCCCPGKGSIELEIPFYVLETKVTTLRGLQEPVEKILKARTQTSRQRENRSDLLHLWHLKIFEMIAMRFTSLMT